MNIGLHACIGCHCSTKYLGGHSDLVAGCLTFGSVDLWKTMIHYQTSLGTSMVGLSCKIIHSLQGHSYTLYSYMF